MYKYSEFSKFERIISVHYFSCNIVYMGFRLHASLSMILSIKMRRRHYLRVHQPGQDKLITSEHTPITRAVAVQEYHLQEGSPSTRSTATVSRRNPDHPPATTGIRDSFPAPRTATPAPCTRSFSSITGQDKKTAPRRVLGCQRCPWTIEAAAQM